MENKNSVSKQTQNKTVKTDISIGGSQNSTQNFNTQSDNSAKVKKISIALKKASGSINKVLYMLEKPEFLECQELLVQIDSIIGSLNSSRSQILEHFLEDCLNNNQDTQKLKNQLLKIYKLGR
jgi:DNA-binding FrmR family transcriptional regulator